jgi:branched-chain amino acid transport system permease protein
VQFFLQQCLIGLTNGALVALVALGYTMVYGIIGLINFAHGDLIMLGACLALSLVTGMGLESGGTAATWLGVAGLVVACGLFCGTINVCVDRVVYKPLRHAPKLAPLVSAIGVSFIFMNLGLFWLGPSDRSFPELLPSTNLLSGDGLQLTWKDLLVVVVVVPLMIALSFLVRATSLGRAMRAVAQDPTAAALVGVDVDRVIAATFFIGGALGGAASVIYGLYINTIGFQMGFQNLHGRRARRDRQHPRRRGGRARDRPRAVAVERIRRRAVDRGDRVHHPDRDPRVPSRGPARPADEGEGVAWAPRRRRENGRRRTACRSGTACPRGCASGGIWRPSPCWRRRRSSFRRWAERSAAR